MNDSEMQIAIAEACGWKLHPKNNSIVIPPNSPNSVQPRHTLPDYLNDLNAMHEAVSVFDYDQADEFDDCLCDICKRANDLADNPTPWRFAVTNATAKQRAEAFLKTLYLWKP